jgi:hypothetical protein
MLTNGAGSSGLVTAASQSRGLGAVPCRAGAFLKSYGQRRGRAPPSPPSSPPLLLFLATEEGEIPLAMGF